MVNSPQVAIYTRVSTDSHKQDVTLQLDALNDYCRKMQWTHIIPYIEHASAGTGKNRPIFYQLMQDCRQRKIDIVVVWKIDRLARSMQDFVNTVMELDRLKVRFIAITQSIDTDASNPTSRLLMHVLAAMAEFERELIRERTKLGMAKAMREGKEIGRPKRIFDIEQVLRMRREGKSVREIGKELKVGKRTIERRLRNYDQTTI